MTYPTVHLNGTSRDALVESFIAPAQALRDALDVLAQHGPNGRDYYVQGPAAYAAAAREHEARCAKVREVVIELMALAEETAAEGGL